MIKEAIKFPDANVFPEGSTDHRFFDLSHGKSIGYVYRKAGRVCEKFEYWSVSLWNQAFGKNEYTGEKYISCRCMVMELTERNFTDGTADTQIKIKVLVPNYSSDDQPNIQDVYYTSDSQGKSLKNTGGNPSRSEFNKVIRDQEIDGLPQADQLPPEIDILATAQAFIDQVKAGNLDTPQLILPKST